MIVGAQCYTIRAYVQTPEQIEQSFQKLQAIGYRAIQVSAFGPIEPAQLRALADTHGLSISVTHTDPDRILHDTDAVIAEHKILGCKHIGIGCMPERYRGSIDGIRAFIRDFTPAMRKIHDAGCKLHYHNHAFEYERDGDTLLFDLLAEETDPALLGFILDVYWVQFAGRTPKQQIERLRGRIDVCHFKDMSMAGNEQRMAPVMEGNLDFEGILTACEKAGVSYAMVEQDDTYGKDPFDELAKSHCNLKRAGMQF